MSDGVVIVLDFTRPEVVESRDKLTHSFRSTTSSRRPGRAIEGTVVSLTRRVVVCPFCGSKRMDFDGMHAPRTTSEIGVVLDCINRVWRNGVLTEQRIAHCEKT